MMDTPKLGYIGAESTVRHVRELQQQYNQIVTWYNELAEKYDQAQARIATKDKQLEDLSHRRAAIESLCDDWQLAATHFYHCRECGEGSSCEIGERYARQLGLLVDDENARE